jgi:DNA-binding GntR family transcriptional regulator
LRLIELLRCDLVEKFSAHSDAEDIERMKAAVDELGPEAEDVLRYQSLDEPPRIE